MMKARIIKQASQTFGLPPGTLVHIGTKKQRPPRITIIDYDQNTLQEKEIKSLEECFPFRDSPTVTWINVDGIHDTQLIERIDEHFGIHPLALEDIVNTTQRPKTDEFENNILITLKMLYLDPKGDDIISEHVSLVVGSNYVISFQETEGYDVFNTIRERLRNNKGRVRRMGSDYLAYCLIDCIVDSYFFILEKIDDEIVKLEEEVSSDVRRGLPLDIHRLKRNTIFLRTNIWPLREVIGDLQRMESRIVKKTTVVYLRDLHDHTVHIIDTIETFRDMLSGMHDVYLSELSHRMNEIMKILTIISTIFIPLTFISSIYGMNFQYMPELQWRWGYYDALAFMGLVALVMLNYFRKKKWL